MTKYTYSQADKREWIGNELKITKLNYFEISGGLGPHPKFRFTKYQKDREKAEQKAIEYCEQKEKTHDENYIRYIQSMKGHRMLQDGSGPYVPIKYPPYDKNRVYDLTPLEFSV